MKTDAHKIVYIENVPVNLPHIVIFIDKVPVTTENAIIIKKKLSVLLSFRPFRYNTPTSINASCTNISKSAGE